MSFIRPFVDNSEEVKKLLEDTEKKKRKRRRRHKGGISSFNPVPESEQRRKQIVEEIEETELEYGPHDDEVSRYEHMYDDDGVMDEEYREAIGLLDNYNSNEGSEIYDILSASKEDLVRDGDQDSKEPLSFDEVLEICSRRWSM